MADTTFSRTIGGREILFKPPTDAQLLMVGRLTRTSRQFAEAKEEELDRVQITGGVEKMSMILDIIDSMVVSPVDRDWLEEQIINGSLDLQELVGALDGGEEPAKPVKKVTARKSTTRARRS